MKSLIVLLILIIFLMAILMYPVRIAIKSKIDNDAYAEVDIFLLPFSKCKITVFKLDKKDIFAGIIPEEPNNKSKAEKVGDIIESIPIDWEKLKSEKLNRDKQKENAGKTEIPKTNPKPNLQPKDFLPYIKPMLDKILGIANIERLKIQGNLAGDPAICAMLGGGIWGILSVAFGVLSTKVNKFPKDHLLKMTLMEEKPYSLDADIQVYLRLFGGIIITIYMLKIFLKLKLQKRKMQKKLKKGVN